MKNRLPELIMRSIIVIACAASGVICLTLEQYANAFSLFIAGPTIGMALWYWSRMAIANEQLLKRTWLLDKPASAKFIASTAVSDDPTMDELTPPPADVWTAPRDS